MADSTSSTPEESTPLVRAGQLFVIPLAIVLACVGVYLLFSYLAGERGTPREWIEELKRGGTAARRQAAHNLAAELGRQAAAGRTDPTLFEPMCEALRTLPADEDEIRWTLVMGLGLLRDPRAVPVLVEELRRRSDPAGKAACIEALGAMKAVDAAPELARLLDDESTVVRKYATFNLAAIAAPARKGEAPAVPSAAPQVRRKLEDPRPEVQWNAATALAVFLGDPAGAAVLRRMLDRKYLEQVIAGDKQESALVAHAMMQACQAVAALRDVESGGILRRVADGDPDAGVRDAARGALAALAGR